MVVRMCVLWCFFVCTCGVMCGSVLVVCGVGVVCVHVVVLVLVLCVSCGVVCTCGVVCVSVVWWCVCGEAWHAENPCVYVQNASVCTVRTSPCVPATVRRELRSKKWSKKFYTLHR